jgi:photosystem II stability/assembly factor-like uncharacterized protein
MLETDSSVSSVLAPIPTVILAPNPKCLWRIGQAGKIARSTDSGETWTPQTSGVTADLTTVSDQICWIVGKAGTILLTTDGGNHWNRLSAPVFEDLAHVYATDALHASVSDAARQAVFETADGGKTWRKQVNY